MSGTGSPVWYRIVVEGVLDDHWTSYLEGLQIHRGSSDTVISGPVADQAALHGVLAKIRDLGLVLISVRRLDPDQAARTAGLDGS